MSGKLACCLVNGRLESKLHYICQDRTEMRNIFPARPKKLRLALFPRGMVITNCLF